jgi:hypothetical protein
MSRGFPLKNTKIKSITAIVVISMMLAACATPNGPGFMSQGDPCQPNAGQSSFNPTTSFTQQAILSPLANIGGSLLATAAQNYSGKYTGKLNKLLTKLVTPKKKKNKNQAQQPVEQGNPYGDQGNQPGYGYENQVDPNTGYPIQDPSGYPGQDGYGQTQEQIDPNTGYPFQDSSGFPGQDNFDQSQEQIAPNTGFPVNPGIVDQGQFQTFEEGAPQGQFDETTQGDIQTRGVPGQGPHARFPSTNPCDPQQTAQQYPQNNQQDQPNGYDPYGQQQGQNPYGQSDPYAQQGHPQDPYGQQQDPYAQQGYPNDPNSQPGYPNDPYAQQGNPYDQQQDPYAQQGYPNDPNNQPGYPNDPNVQQGYPQGQQQDPYAQQGYPQDPNMQPGYPGDGGRVGTPIGLDVVMLKKTVRNGASVMLPIKDGDVLKDGRGNVQAGDKFRIMFRPHTDGYVYVVAIDGSGWAQGIFPPATSPLANPVKAGEEYTLPEGTNWFSLDQFKGIETIFFVASQEKRTDPEGILQSIGGHERPANATPQQVTKVAMVPFGVGGSRPSTQGFNLPAGSGQDQSIMPTSYFSKTAGQDLRLTRWFQHQ